MSKILTNKAKAGAKDFIKQASFREARNESDTVQVWENYREQALLWRALAIFQIPTTALAILLSIILWNQRETVLDVPARPLPGFYQAGEVTDEEFVGRAREFVNLIASYQPDGARQQFFHASRYLIEPVLTRYNIEMMDTELKAIENTRRSQLFFIDPTKTEIERTPYDEVIVTFRGAREKLVAGQKVPEVLSQFRLTMTTIPRNELNPFGIVISNIETTNTIKQN
jgi:hypothetical protein